MADAAAARREARRKKILEGGGSRMARVLGDDAYVQQELSAGNNDDSSSELGAERMGSETTSPITAPAPALAPAPAPAPKIELAQHAPPSPSSQSSRPQPMGSRMPMAGHETGAPSLGRSAANPAAAAKTASASSPQAPSTLALTLLVASLAVIAALFRKHTSADGEAMGVNEFIYAGQTPDQLPVLPACVQHGMASSSPLPRLRVRYEVISDTKRNGSLRLRSR